MTVVDNKKLGGRTLYWLYLRDEWVPCYIAGEYPNTPDRAYIHSCMTYGSGMSLEVLRKDLKTDVELFMQGINPEIEHEKQRESIRKKMEHNEKTKHEQNMFVRAIIETQQQKEIYDRLEKKQQEKTAKAYQQKDRSRKVKTTAK